MNALLEALKTMAGTAGTVIDTPGSIGRGLAIGDLDRAFGGIGDPRRRVGVDEVIKKYPMLDALVPEKGLPGMIGKMGVGMATDPLTLALLLGPAMLGMTKLIPKMAPLGRAGLSPAPTAAKAAGWTRGGAAGAKAAAKPAAKVVTMKTAATPAASKTLAEQAARASARQVDDAAHLAKVVSRQQADVAKTMGKLTGAIPPEKMGAAQDLVRAYQEAVGIGQYDTLKTMVARGGKQLSETEIRVVMQAMGRQTGKKGKMLEELLRSATERLGSWHRTQF